MLLISLGVVKSGNTTMYLYIVKQTKTDIYIAIIIRSFLWLTHACEIQIVH